MLYLAWDREINISLFFATFLYESNRCYHGNKSAATSKRGIFVYTHWVPNCMQNLKGGWKLSFPKMFDSYRDLFLNCHVQPVRFALYYLVMQCCFRENHGTAVAVAFTSIFLAKIEKKSINNWSTNKPLVWKSIGIMTTFSVCRVQT